MQRLLLPAVLLVVLASTAPCSRAGDPPASPAAPSPHAELARLLRSPEAPERARGVVQLALLEAAPLREALAAAAGSERELEAWSRTLLGLAREAEGARRRELVRALLAVRARLRVPSPAVPSTPPPPGAADRAWVLDVKLVQARGAALTALLGAPSVSKAPRLLADADLARAIAAGEAAKDASVLGSPVLALVGAGEAALAVTRQRAYVERYEVTPGSGASSVVSPVVDTLEEGLRCAASALPMTGESATFRLRVDLFEAAEPLDTFEAPLAVPGRAEELTVRVQVPDVHVTRVERALPLVRDLWTVVAVADPPLSRGVGSVVVLARANAQPSPAPAAPR